MNTVRAVDWDKFARYRYRSFLARDIASRLVSKYSRRDMPTWAFVVYMFGLANPMFEFRLPTSAILPNPRVHVIVDNSKARDKGPSWPDAQGVFSPDTIKALVSQITSEGTVDRPLLDIQANVAKDRAWMADRTNAKQWAELS